MIKGWIILVLICSCAPVGADELSSIFSSRTIQQLRMRKLSSLRFEVTKQACRLQIKQKRIPTACLKNLNPSQVATACQSIEPQRVSSREIQRALQFKGWGKNCRLNLQQMQKRKFYQEQDANVGVSFESIRPDGTSSTTNAFLL